MGEFYSDHDGYDFLAAADFRRDELEASFPCQTCGSLEPAVIEGSYCSDCTGANRTLFLAAREARLTREITDAA